MTNQPPTRITWSDDDKVDPYPAILEALNEVFEFASSSEADNMGGSEPAIIAMMRQACMHILEDHDPASTQFIS